MSNEHLAIHQKVYYFDSKEGWLRGVIQQINNDKVTVLNNDTDKTVVVPSTYVHSFIAESYDPEDPDLFHVSDLHVATLLYCIKDRFVSLHLQYSMMGEMVLSVNPFRLMQFNSIQERKKYLAKRDPRNLPPHIWQVAHKAFNAITFQNSNNQSVIVSGESGSGKTENTKSLIAYLGQLSYMRSENSFQRSIADKIDENLTWSNPLLESFGNARTVRNDNSSRFGKYIKLYFDLSGILMGGETVTYLLERSRIIMQSGGERNYHIFYEMLAGLTEEEKKFFGGLKTAYDYKCLNGGGTFIRRGIDGNPLNDAEEFKSVRQAIRNLGIPEETEMCFFRVLAAILHLMEIEFTSDANDKAEILNEDVLVTACNLLEVDPSRMKECFLVKSHTTHVTILLTKLEAEGFRNSFCKDLYIGLFDRIVEYVNQSIKPEGQCNEYKYIGLLDIFGFEKFERNSFEQLCINYANETLQNHYNKYTFFNDEDECKSEGIEIPKVVFPDNSERVDMFETKPNGIFAMLDEECSFKAGNSARYTTNLWEHWANRNAYFVLPKSTIPNQFGINHYAAFVEYNTDEWLEKNTDGLKDDICAVVADSSNNFIAQLLSTSKIERRRKQTVAFRFQNQLQKLREEMESTETQFIHCIKPNSAASPELLENFLVGSQLESAGVLQTIALKRQGYPVRRKLHDFSKYFYLIMPRNSVSFFKKQNYTESSKTLLDFYQRLYNWSKPNFAIGNTKVFLRATVWSSLERLVLRRRAQLLNRTTPYLRRWIEDFRERKRIEEEKRLAELKRLHEERMVIAQECANGLPMKKIQWVVKLCNIFPDLDMSILLDIVAESKFYHEAIKGVLSIQEQSVDLQAMDTMINFMTTADVRGEVISTFLEEDIKSLAAISRLKQEDFKVYGCNDNETAVIICKLLEHQGRHNNYERLSQAIGTAKEDVVVEFIESVQSQRLSEDFNAKVTLLVEMGFLEENARLVLAHYNGDMPRTIGRLLYGIDHDMIRYNIRKHPEYTTADPNVQRFIAMGATKLEAKSALRKASGDLNIAAKALFRMN